MSENKTHDQNHLCGCDVAPLVIVGHPQSRRLVLIFLLSPLFLHKHHREAKRMKIESSCLMSSTNTREPPWVVSVLRSCLCNARTYTAEILSSRYTAKNFRLKVVSKRREMTKAGGGGSASSHMADGCAEPRLESPRRMRLGNCLRLFLRQATSQAQPEVRYISVTNSP